MDLVSRTYVSNASLGLQCQLGFSGGYFRSTISDNPSLILSLA